MKNSFSTLTLYLDAPLQSWGYQSRFDRRTTFSMPTRSGILGMICAAMGIDRTDSKALEKFIALKLTCLALKQHVRLIDFHTIGGGWDKKINPNNLIPTAEGKPGQTKITRREYLQWSKFGVLIQGSEKILHEIAEALKNPRWGIWLGRKSCIPASPVFQGIFSSTDEAIEHLMELSGTSVERMVEEVTSFEDGSDTLNDIPLNFHTRQFAPRRIRT